MGLPTFPMQKRQDQRSPRAECRCRIILPPIRISVAWCSVKQPVSHAAAAAGRSHQSKSAASLSQSSDATRAEYDRFGGVGISMARQSKSPARLLLPEHPIHGLANVRQLLALGCQKRVFPMFSFRRRGRARAATALTSGPLVLLSRIAPLDQRTALPDQCLHLAEADVRPPRRKSGFDCVKKTRERHAVGEMRGGPSESPCRRRLQTAMSCFGQKPRW